MHSYGTISRIMQFTIYYLNMFNEMVEEKLIVLGKMERGHKKEKMKNRLIRKMTKNNLLLQSTSSDSRSLNSSLSEMSVDDDSDLDEDSEIDDDNKLFDSKFTSKLVEDINKNNQKENEEIILIIDTSTKNNKNENAIKNLKKSYSDDVDKEAEQTLKNKEIKLSKIFRTKNKKLNIKIKFEMRKMSLIFPLDDSKSVTKVLKVKSNINGNIYLKTNIDLIRNGNDQLIKINFNEK